MKDLISPLEVTPARFYALAEVIQALPDEKLKGLKLFVEKTEGFATQIDDQVSDLARSNNELMQQMRVSTRTNKNAFRSLEDQVHDFDDYQHSVGDSNFLRVAFDCLREIQNGHLLLLNVASDLKPKALILSEEKFVPGKLKSGELQNMMYEFQLNTPAMNRFITGLDHASALKDAVLMLVRNANKTLDNYYRKLLNRHSVEGVEIFHDAIATDVAMSIFENVDSHGEIADGKNPDEVSAYTIHKAEVITSALKDGVAANFIRNPEKFIEFLTHNFTFLWEAAALLSDLFADEIKNVKEILDVRLRQRTASRHEFDAHLNELKDLDPRNVVYKEKQTLLTAEERFNIKFRNETLEEIVHLMRDPLSSSGDLIKYILTRKKYLKDYFQDENSFYVCKIGNGNPFLGDAPGGLTVVPGQRPNVNLEEIIGSGFAEVKDFIGTIESSSKWHDLFLATSPSKTTDKSNVLLVGPMGCGKSEILRAVGGDKKSIGIFAQGSDFLTCWKGEAEKNPKRLFEAGLRIQKESRKHVHFLIDEIDSLLKKPEHTSHGDNNLTLEFQILMDGVVHYPNLSVWGATNSPERIPMPMIRRFSKVLIVGELSQEDRIKLLKQFIDYLPVQDFNDEAWESMARRLDGATGDVVRKVIDHIWRTKMSWFVQHHMKEAYEMVEILNKDEKFQLANFDDKRKFNFKQKLGKYVHVRPDDLDAAIRTHLKNIAIRSEIETAKETYAKAKKFLNQINSGEV